MEHLLKSVTPALHKALTAIRANVHCKIDCKSSEDSGLGLYASEYIPKDKTIFEVHDSIPGYRMVHVEEFKEKIVSDILDYTATLHPDRPSVLEELNISFQISQLLRNTALPLNDYVQFLPTENLKFAIYWKNPAVTHSIYLRQMVADDVRIVKACYDKIYELERRALSSVSFEEFAWTLLMTNSRSIDTTRGLQLVPMIDIINHSFQENCTVQEYKHSFQLVSTTDIEPGTQLTRNYGKFDTYHYISKYGFIPDYNPYHRFYTYPDHIAEWAKSIKFVQLHDKNVITEFENPRGFSMKTLKKALIDHNNVNGWLEVPLNQEPPSKYFEKAFRIFYLKPEEMKQRGIQSLEECFDINFDLPVAEKNERRVKTMLLKVCEFHLSCMPIESESISDWGVKLDVLEQSILKNHIDEYQKLLF